MAALVIAGSAFATDLSIPADELDRQSIYWGSPKCFTTPAEVDFDEAVTHTPEYETIKNKKIQRGSAKYMILWSRASDRVTRAIAEVGEDSDYDLIAAAGYLGDLKTPIDADDITDTVIEEIESD